MVKIEGRIKSKYNIDIKKINIIKLYRIDNPNLSTKQLEEKIADCRKRWNQSINGANEKFAERDRKHLEAADKYEEILHNKKIRTELYQYYTSSQVDESVLEFAREYFGFIARTTKINKDDVEFFFAYYTEQRKNKKYINEMLKTEYKVQSVQTKNDVIENEEKELEGKKKKSPLISNFFQEATILKLHKCETLYLSIKENKEISEKIKKMSTSFYEFLEIERFDQYLEFKRYIENQRKIMSDLRYDKGKEYAPLVDLFNILNEILENKDIIDNFTEFKLLVQYPKLTPYMCRIVDMKSSTLKVFYKIASREYDFRDLNDFILTYFIKIYDNFGICDQSIKFVMNKAKKNVGQKKLFDSIERILRIRKGKRTSWGIKLFHFLAYWPIYLLFAIFEIVKFVIDNLRYISFISFVPMLIFTAKKGPEFYGVDFAILKGISSKEIWYPFLNQFVKLKTDGIFEVIFASIMAIILLLVLYIGPAVMGTLFLWLSASDLTKRYDWRGIERTLLLICKNCRQKTERQYEQLKEKLYWKFVFSLLIHVLCLAVTIAVAQFVLDGCDYMSENLKAKSLAWSETWSKTNQKDDDTSKKTKESVEKEETKRVKIKAENANIRSGAGKEKDIITVVSKGDIFVTTGKEKTAANGRKWYEIYLDDTKTETGWISEKVLQKLN